mmetsp:Transcript_17624/g.44381  ORF Transcript_17624/g.44381 Transcript_17624/m.44381 type:complete len:281 (-) Transcript_17624:257-1099(-)
MWPSAAAAPRSISCALESKSERVTAAASSSLGVWEPEPEAPLALPPGQAPLVPAAPTFFLPFFSTNTAPGMADCRSAFRRSCTPAPTAATPPQGFPPTGCCGCSSAVLAGRATDRTLKPGGALAGEAALAAGAAVPPPAAAPCARPSSALASRAAFFMASMYAACCAGVGLAALVDTNVEVTGTGALRGLLGAGGGSATLGLGAGLGAGGGFCRCTVAALMAASIRFCFFSSFFLPSSQMMFLILPGQFAFGHGKFAACPALSIWVLCRMVFILFIWQST